MVPVPLAAAAFAGPATPRTSPDATRSSGSSRWPSVRSTLGRGLVGSMIGPPVVHDIVDLTISFDYFIRGQSLELSLIHISEPTRRTPISYAVFCLKQKKAPV